MTLVDRIKVLAARPQGMCSNDIDTHSTTAVGRACWRMGQRGELHQVKLSHRSVRWFADPARAEALQAKVYAGNRVVVLGTRQKLLGEAQRARAAGCATRVLVAQWPADAPAIETEHTIFTRCPGFVPRFQEFVHPFVHGGLRAA